MLKERRESDDLYSIYLYADSEEADPARENEELAEKLDNNASIASKNLSQVRLIIDKFSFLKGISTLR